MPSHGIDTIPYLELGAIVQQRHASNHLQAETNRHLVAACAERGTTFQV